MKTPFLVAAALLVATVAAQAQITPTSPERSGSQNQTTVPAAPPSNPSTLDQRTPTTANPTQTGTGTDAVLSQPSPQLPQPCRDEQ